MLVEWESVIRASRFGFSFMGSDFYDEAVECIGDFDLAAEPAGAFCVLGELEGVLFDVRGRADPVHPLLRDVDVTGGAGADAPAVTFDAINSVVEGKLHQGSVTRFHGT